VDANGDSTLAQYAYGILSGDAYIISGNSNALRMGPTVGGNNFFFRTYGRTGHCETNSDPIHANCNVGGCPIGCPSTDPEEHVWVSAKTEADCSVGEVGTWGYYLGEALVNAHNIPIVIFNGADGGRVQDCFMPYAHEDNTIGLNNYNRLLQRVEEAGFRDRVRGMIWYQGERDGIESTNPQHFKEGFQNLYDAWLVDYYTPAAQSPTAYSLGLERIYTVQIREGCPRCVDGNVIPYPHTKIGIQEAQRQLAAQYENALVPVRIVTVGELEYHVDGCHYYPHSHQVFASKLSRILSYDLYNTGSGAYIDAPSIDHAYFSGSQEVTMVLRNQTDGVEWEAGAEQHFNFHDCEGNVLPSVSINPGVMVNNNSFIFSLNNPNNEYIESFSYLGDKWAEIENYTNVNDPNNCERPPIPLHNSFKWVKNDSNMTMVAFKEVPIQGNCRITDADFIYTQHPFYAARRILFFTPNVTGSCAKGLVYDWDFGDGRTARGKSAKRFYRRCGTYNVTLTVTDTLNNCSVSVCNMVEVCGNESIAPCNSDSLLIPNDLIPQARVSVYPNPMQEKQILKLEFSEAISGRTHIQLMDINGRVVFNRVYHYTDGQRTEQIPTDKIESGIYFLKISTGDFVESKKIIIN